MHAFFCILSFILGMLYVYMDQGFVLIYFPICLQFTFVGSCYLFCRCFINFTAVYPETKGVPLEEMDAVFGEGVSFIILLWRIC